MVEDRLKIAVFVDFDNIEIGVKSTLNRHFDIGAVLEAIKERGEVVTKIAYGDWKRAGEHSRSMTQHAIQMVQRNLTPGGDKNGADINLALDALEMAFTRNHINAFVIVGGDSDFIALVEKLKQYDKKVFVVGGRAFTSAILQKNCHEFIAYENLIAPQGGQRRQAEREVAAAPANGQSMEQTHVPPPAPTPVQAEEGVRAMQEAFQKSNITPHWPMYLRNVKQFIKNASPTFDEHRYGFHSFLEAVRHAQRAGLLRLERNRQGILRVFPGNQMPQLQRGAMPRIEQPSILEPPMVPYDVEEQPQVQESEPEPVLQATPPEEVSEPQPEAGELADEPQAEAVEEQPVRKRRASSGLKRKTVAPRRSAGTTVKRTRKKASPPPEEEGSLP